MISFCDTMIGAERQEILEHGTTEFPVACYFDDLGQKMVPWHWHEELEIGIVDSGSMTIRTPDRQCRIKAGEGFFINSGVLHAIQGQKPGACYLDSLVFHARLAGGNIDSIFWRRYIRPVTSGSGITVLRFDGDSRGKPVDIIRTAWMECVNGDYGFEVNVRYLLSQLFLVVSREQPSVPPADAKRMQHYNERIKKMLTYIREHYQENITVQKIAGSAAVSESECLRCFRNVLEISPIEYVKRYRLQKAAELIHTTQWKISYIAQQCGFHDMSYFSKSFKTVYQCTPLAYRSRDKEGI